MWLENDNFTKCCHHMHKDRMNLVKMEWTSHPLLAQKYQLFEGVRYVPQRYNAVRSWRLIPRGLQKSKYEVRKTMYSPTHDTN